VGEELFDVVVIGAGPAGTSAADYAAKQGVRVCLLEKDAEIGCPIRTSGATFVAKLRDLGIPQHLYHPVRILRFVGPTRTARFVYPDPVACVLDVRGLYQHLAVKAAATGVEIRLVRQVTDARRESDGSWTIVARTPAGHEQYSARVVVDASGFARVVQRKAGFCGPVRRFGLGAEYDLFTPDWPENEAALVVGSDVAPSGYGWVFPHGNRRTRVGVGVIRPDTSARPHDYLIRLMRAPAIVKDLDGAQPIEMHVGYIPSEPVGARCVYDGLLAVGDAAGHASPLVGEGIRYAIVAGRRAGTVAGECVRNGDSSATALGRFEKLWQAEQGRFMRIAYEINRRLARYTDDMWDARIAVLERLPRELFLQALMTEFTAGWAARVVIHAPRVIAPLFRFGILGY
jgi:digeranylgeranylglycerophospholipid reductase